MFLELIAGITINISQYKQQALLERKARMTVVTEPPDSVKTYIMGEVNKYRVSQGLSEVKTDKYTCDFAKVRAIEISKNFNHDGFSQRINSKTLPYPSYSYANENIAMNSNYKNVVPAWINSSGHAKNMRANTPLVCVESSGNFYAYEGYRS